MIFTIQSMQNQDIFFISIFILKKKNDEMKMEL
jgi:hypothetical protein